MKIQWSGAAVQEMLVRLARAEQRMEDCMRQSERLRTAIRDANADGENRALLRVEERCDALMLRLKRHGEALQAFRLAVRRADERFEEAEAQVGRFAELVARAQAAPPPANALRGPRFAEWSPAAYAVMPEARVRVAAEPDWLREAVRHSKLT